MFWIWTGFILFIILLVALDLGVFNRRLRAPTPRAALLQSALWIAMGVAFSLVIFDGYRHHRLGLGTSPDAIDGRFNAGASAAAKYLTAYVLEKSLSIDNLFVIAIIFRFLAVPPEFQHRVLVAGILGAVILRGGMIAVGVELIAHYHWILYLFGGFLLFTGLRLLFMADEPPDPSANPVLRAAKKLLPLTSRYDGGRLLTRENAKWVFTPLALALLLVETGDALFAVDSIPAAFGVTADPLLVFTSNIMAIVGLRSLYFDLAGLMEKYSRLKTSLSLILLLVGAKMLAAPWIKPFLGDASLYLLAVIALLLGAGIVGSILLPVRMRT